MINNAQIKIIHTLYNLLHLDADEKEGFVLQFTKGRCTSSTGMSFHEATAMINALKKLVDDSGINKKADKMRKLIIHYARQMGWEMEVGSNQLAVGSKQPPRKVADMPRINGWCIKYSYLHKPLNSYKYNELPALVTQFEKVYKSFLNGVFK